MTPWRRQNVNILLTVWEPHMIWTGSFCQSRASLAHSSIHSTLPLWILFETSHCSSFLQVTPRWKSQAFSRKFFGQPSEDCFMPVFSTNAKRPFYVTWNMCNFKFNFLLRGQLESLNLDRIFLPLFKTLPCYISLVFSNARSCFITVYNIDKTLCALWLVKNPCSIKVINIEKACFYCFARVKCIS